MDHLLNINKEFKSLNKLVIQTIYTKKELDKACFDHDAAYSDSKDLIKRTVADKISKNRAFNIAKDPKYDGYQRGLASMVYKFFDKKSSGSGAKHVNTKITPQNEQLADEPYKPIIGKLEKRKVYSAFKDNIWGPDLEDMQLLSKYNKGIRFLLCVIDIFSKYAWVVPLKDRKGVMICICMLMYVMYSTHNEGKPVVAGRFIRTLKRKIYKSVTSITKNVYINKLDDIVNEYSNTYHTTIKMKPIDVKDNTYINTSKKINYKDPKFKVGDRVRISKYKNIFAKGYILNWSEEMERI